MADLVGTSLANSKSVPATLEQVQKASEIAKTLVSDLQSNTILLLSALFASVFLCGLPDSFLPGRVSNFRWMFFALAIFLWTYCFLVVWNEKYRVRKAIWNLKHLGIDESTILVEYLKQNKTVAYFHMPHGPVFALVSKGILWFPANLIDPVGTPVAIQPFIMVCVKKHPEIIGLNIGEIGSEKVSNPAIRGY